MAVDINGQYIPTANTKLLLHMEGNSNDSSGNGFNLTNNGTIPFNYAKFNKGADFGTTNTTKYLSIANNLGITSGNITISLWVKMNTEISTGQQVFIYHADASKVVYEIFYDYNAGTRQLIFARVNTDTAFNSVSTPLTMGTSNWYNLILTYDGTNVKGYINGSYINLKAASGVGGGATTTIFTIGSFGDASLKASAIIDEVIVENVAWTASEVLNYYNQSLNYFSVYKSKYVTGKDAGTGRLPHNSNSEVGTDLAAWKKFQTMLMKSVNGGTIFSKEVVSTYPLVYTSPSAYMGGVLDLNGSIHFAPFSAPVGQKISSTGVVSTYSLVYTVGGGGFTGGVLAPNGDIHFAPISAMGQKISANGVVSTYSLVYTVGNGYRGGVLASNGDIHFTPYSAAVGQKISALGVISTYSLVYTAPFAYWGGCLSPNGDIHFSPSYALVGQKISALGIVSTYSLINTGTARSGACLSSNGDIHFISQSNVGQKISISGVVSTYSLISNGFFSGGVLAPNGDMHMIPYYAQGIGQKISAQGVVSTYTLVYSAVNETYNGGILMPNGDIHFVPMATTVGQKISTFPAIPFPQAVCQSPFFNKL